MVLALELQFKGLGGAKVCKVMRLVGLQVHGEMLCCYEVCSKQRGGGKASCIAPTSLSVAGPLVNRCKGWIWVAGSGPFTALALPAPLYHNKRPKC